MAQRSDDAFAHYAAEHASVGKCLRRQIRSASFDATIAPPFRCSHRQVGLPTVSRSPFAVPHRAQKTPRVAAIGCCGECCAATTYSSIFDAPLEPAATQAEESKCDQQRCSGTRFGNGGGLELIVIPNQEIGTIGEPVGIEIALAPTA